MSVVCRIQFCQDLGQVVCASCGHFAANRCLRSGFSWYHCLLAHVCEQQQATSRHARMQTALTGRARFVVAHTTITGSANKLRRMPARLVRAWPDSFVPFLATRRMHAQRHAGNTTSRVQTLSTATKRRQKKRQKRDQIPGSVAQAKTTQALCCPKRSTAQNPGSDPGPDSGFGIRPVSNRHLQPWPTTWGARLSANHTRRILG